VKLWYTKPAYSWNEALPVGNGRLGGMVFGDVQCERIQLNEDTVWYGGHRNRHNPDAIDNLQKIRNLLFEGKIHEAEFLTTHALQSTPRNQKPYQSLGDLNITFFDPDNKYQMMPGWGAGNVENITDYHRELDFNTGVVRISYRIGDRSFLREVFCSAVDQVIAVRFSCDKPGQIFLAAELGRRPFEMMSTKISLDGILLAGQGGPDGVHYAAVLKGTNEGGRLFNMGHSLIVQAADSVTLMLAANTSFRYDDPKQHSTYQVSNALSKGYVAVRQDHIEDYQALFGRVSLELTDEDVIPDLPTNERLKRFASGKKDNGFICLYFQFGRYLMISCSRPGAMPANLQGIWNQEMTPPWESKYTININTQMNYWPAEVCNLSECHLPLFDHIERIRENGSATARILYGCRGFVAHHNVDLWADTAPVGESISSSMWPMGAAWLCLHLWDHYQFGREISFLREKAYPLMKAAAEFFLDYLSENPEGYLVTSPSISPENQYISADGSVGTLCMGPAMDIQILRELFNALIDSCDILETDRSFKFRLAQTLKRLPSIQIGKHGQIMEWSEDYDELEPGHRHISHLFALHPGSQISVSSTPSLAVAARKTLERRLAHGGGHTGWSRAWIINFWARLREGEKAYDNLRELLTSSTLPNLFCDHPPFQIDGNFGGIAGIAEMLLQSHEGHIYLLPALPKSWPNGHVKGLRARGGVSLDIHWQDGEMDNAVVHAEKSGKITIRSKDRLKVKDKTSIEAYNHDLHSLELQIEEGHFYVLFPIKP
jgi:alpha-L-fucosidase 2